MVVAFIVGFVVGCSVTGLLFATVVDGLFVVLRATVVDLTVVVLVLLLVFVGSSVVAAGVVFMLCVELVFSSDSTENVVTSRSSAETVVGSTLTIKLDFVGLGRVGFVDSTNEIVVSTAGVVVVDDALLVGILVVVVAVAIGFLVVVAFLRDVIVVLRFTVRTVDDATGFLVIFITVEVAFFGFCVVAAGLCVVAAGLRVATVVREFRLAGVLVVLAVGFFVRLGSVAVDSGRSVVVAFSRFES